MAEKEEKIKGRKKSIRQKENDITFADEDKILEVMPSPTEPKLVGVKDSYLPHVLVKLKVCTDNAEARKYIRTKGVVVNGIPTNSCDVTTEGLKIEQFELTVEGEVYHIFLI